MKNQMCLAFQRIPAIQTFLKAFKFSFSLSDSLLKIPVRLSLEWRDCRGGVSDISRFKGYLLCQERGRAHVRAIRSVKHYFERQPKTSV